MRPVGYRLSLLRFRRNHVGPACSARGFTLVELLVAMAVTLLLLGSVVSLFAFLGDTVNDSKTDIEMLQRVRHARDLLQSDLESLTLKPIPAKAGVPQRGFFEYVEGVERESAVVLATGDSRMGDRDDKLAFTIQSQAESLIGRFAGTGVESRTAEVVWFVTGTSAADPTDLTQGPLRLHRVQLLVAPAAVMVGADPATYFAANDVSARLDSNGDLVANSLEDLSLRENRLGRSGTANPMTPATLNTLVALLGSRLEESIVLTNILAFDVRVWDPGAPVATAANATPGVALQPGDHGYATAIGNAQIADFGAYVDLFDYLPAGYTLATNAPMPIFNGPGDSNSGLEANATLPATYDTWTGRVTTGSKQLNGFDDNPTVPGGVDDASEQTMSSSSPPYPVPLKGIQVILRVYEPSSRNVRSVTIRRSF